MTKKAKAKIMITKDGPYLVYGGLPIDKQIIGIGEEGEPEKWIKGKDVPAGETCALCRCGESKSAPLCDGTHAKVNFDGTETTSRETFDKQAKIMDGPTLKLKDIPPLCASARFCHRGGGTWELTYHSGDPNAKALAIEG